MSAAHLRRRRPRGGPASSARAPSCHGLAGQSGVNVTAVSALMRTRRSRRSCRSGTGWPRSRCQHPGAAHSAHRQASNSCRFRVSGSNTRTPKLHAGAGAAKAQSSRIRQGPTAPERPAGPAIAEATSPRGRQLVPRKRTDGGDRIVVRGDRVVIRVDLGHACRSGDSPAMSAGHRPPRRAATIGRGAARLVMLPMPRLPVS